MRRTQSRRRFLKSAAAAAALASPLYSVMPARAVGANERIGLASIGVGGKGASDLSLTAEGQDVVAVCDVDLNALSAASATYPNAKTFQDWRKLLEHPNIDAVTVSTPDHMHATITLAAIQAGKHVYTQKPLTHDVYEARQLQLAAEKAGIVSQMGIQHHSSARLQNAVQLIRDGVIGSVKEVHAWTDRPGTFWKQGLKRPEKADNVPESLDWNAWLGTAPRRPYVEGLYHRFHWRGWWDFGTGALGDMGCHLLDPVIHALELTAPSLIQAEGPEPEPESGPLWCIVDYTFPGTRWTSDSLKVRWYEAGKMPDRKLFQAPDDWPGSKNGVLYIGEKGNLFVGFPEPPQLFPTGEFTSVRMPDHRELNHYTQWTGAIQGKDEVTCSFSYAAPLTETVLLGNVAYRTGKPIQWDSKSLTAVDCPEADRFIRRQYREGWQVEGL